MSLRHGAPSGGAAVHHLFGAAAHLASSEAAMRLQLDAIRKSFGGVQALSGASLSAEAGEIHAILGENGAGKSTLLKVLSGVHTSFEGTIRIEGQEQRFHTPAQARAAGVAMVHQELML